MPPIADAGKRQIVKEGDTVTLDGSGSCDVAPENFSVTDGCTSAERRRPLTYQWTQGEEQGQSLALSNADRSRATFTAPAAASLRFTLTVTDKHGKKDSQETGVRVIASTETLPPTADAGKRQVVAEGARVTLRGSGKGEPGRTLSYRWFNGGYWDGGGYRSAAGENAAPGVTLSNSNRATASFTAPRNLSSDRGYFFTLYVEDSEGLMATDGVTVTVTASNPARPPLTVKAGPDQWVLSGDLVTLQGHAAGGPAISALNQPCNPRHFPLADPPAVPGRYTLRPTFTAPEVAMDVEVEMKFRLTATAIPDDGNTETATDGVSIWVRKTSDGYVRPRPEDAPPQEQAPPIASGQARVVSPCIVVELDELTGPVELQAAWDVADCNAHHREDGPARYFRFTLSAGTTVDIDLQSEQPAVMFVSKGTPQNGWGSPPATLEHRLEVRRNNGKLLHEEATQATLTLSAGEYTVEAVSGSGQEVGSFNLAIAPAAPPVVEAFNSPPVISAAAADPERAASGSAVRLTGQAADSQDAVGDLSFLWEQIRGIPEATLENAGTAAAAFTAPPVESDTDLTFRLTVTDSGGLTASAETTIAISPPSEPEPEPAPVTSCLTDLGSLTGAAEFSGAWDDADCRAHHRADSPARYFHFTLPEETTVSISLASQEDGALFRCSCPEAHRRTAGARRPEPPMSIASTCGATTASWCMTAPTASR